MVLARGLCGVLVECENQGMDENPYKSPVETRFREPWDPELVWIALMIAAPVAPLGLYILVIVLGNIFPPYGVFG